MGHFFARISTAIVKKRISQIENKFPLSSIEDWLRTSREAFDMFQNLPYRFGGERERTCRIRFVYL